MSLFTRWQAANANKVFGACLLLESLVFRSAMGGGNGQKSKTARERNMEKQKAAKGIHSFYSLLVYTLCHNHNQASDFVRSMIDKADFGFSQEASLRPTRRPWPSRYPLLPHILCYHLWLVWNLIEIWNHGKLKFSSFPLFPVLLSVNHDISVKIVWFH